MEWLMQLEQAITYMEDHLDQEISFDQAAGIACCSPYYFGRMFSYVAGISLSEYIRRRRMTQAAFELQYTETKILDISLKYGYSSPTAFNRAFQSVHGLSPAAARQPGCILNAYPPLKFSVQITGGDSMPYRIEKKEPIRIVGVRTNLTDDMEENHKIAPAFWNQMWQGDLLPRICSLSNQKPDGILGLSVYHSPEEIFYYIAAATDRAVPEGMHEYEIPASAWVIFESDGPFKENIQTIFKRFFTEWLPFSGYVYAQLPDLEIYPASNTKTPGGHSEVWIGIKRKGVNNDKLSD